jgi:hypothetical protein
MSSKSLTLIPNLGAVHQLAFVSKDVSKELKYWTETMGVGPFYHFERLKTKSTVYREQAQDIEFSVYIAYWGDMQIELVEQHNDAPSIFCNWLNKNREGLHHMAVAVDDLAMARKQCLEVGAKIEQEIELFGGAQAIYVDTGECNGSLIEFIQLAPGARQLFESMKTQAQYWDGHDPVRKINFEEAGCR